MISCFGSKSLEIDKRTLWENMKYCKEYLGEHTTFKTREGLEGIYKHNYGRKAEVLVYVRNRRA